MGEMDPFAVLGLAPGASPEEIAAAYRRQAKRWHPDRAGHGGAARMADVNAAYEQLRARAEVAVPVPAAAAAPARRPPPGAWLADATRRALGPELLAALDPGEQVRVVTPAATWASPEAVLAVTDRRLLWLLDDAVTHRVRSLAFAAVDGVEHQLRWPRRRRAVVRVRTKHGRRLAFGELTPNVAARIVGHLESAAT